MSDRHRLTALDGVRGLAIGMVVLFHLTNGHASSASTKVVGRVTGAGWLGVELFFLLSAFLITSQLMKRPAPRTYAERRVRRIVPMYALVLVLFLVLAPILTAVLRHAHVDNSFSRTIPQTGGMTGLQWTFLWFGQNFWMAARNSFLHPSLGVTWSLAVEVQFYFAWFFLMRRNETFVRRFAMASVVAGPLWRLALTLGGASLPRVYVLPLSHLDLFGWGTLLALWYRSGTEVAWLKSKTTIAVAACAFVGWLGLADRVAGQTGFTPGQLSLGITIAAFAIAAIVHRVLTTPGGAIDRALSWRVLTGLGAISYSLYLLHTTIEYFYRGMIVPDTAVGTFTSHHEFAGQLLKFAIVGSASILLSIVTYKLIETPFMRRGQKQRPVIDVRDPDTAKVAPA